MGIPAARHIDVCLVGNVFEFEFSFIQIKFVRDLIARKENILPAVVVKISNTHTAAVVDIFVRKDIKTISLLN